MAQDKRISRAKELLIGYPDRGRRWVNQQLREEFGKGLRARTVGQIALALGRPASLRAQLRVVGFLPFERKILRDFCTGDSRTYLRNAIAERQQLFWRAQTEQWTTAKYRQVIRGLYKSRGWVVSPGATVRKAQIGKADPFAMLRDYRDRSIQKGEYIPPLKVKRKPSDKGNVAAQRARYKAKQATGKLLGIAPMGDKSTWISQLRQRIISETNPDRIAQFQAQIKRLEGLA